MTHVSSEFLAALRDATVLAPQLPESDAFDTLERLEHLEARLVAPSKQWRDVSVIDYKLGSAEEADDVQVYGNESAQTVVSADHATDPYRRKNPPGYRRADHGTGGLAMLLAERGEAVSVVPTGMQTWNVAVSDESHPVKQEILRLLPDRLGFLSLHGMYSGKLRYVTDPTEVHAVIGLGAEPNEQSWQAARKVVAAGKDLGLNISTANEEKLHVCDPETGNLTRNEAGELVTSCLRGSKPDMTNALAYRIMERTGTTKRSMQLEMAAVLRMVALDDDGGWHKDRTARAMGVHLGYLLASAAAQAVQTEYSLE